jgi:predicted glycosyltransferase involved in capsule biosynthesis
MFKVGAPCTLTDEIKEHILSFVEDGVLPHQVARLSKTPYTTLRRWLVRGEEDVNNNESTIYSQFWLDYEHKKGLSVQFLINNLKNAKSWQAHWELLKTMDKENFGADCDAFQKLLENMQKLSDDYRALANKPPVTGRNDG